MSTGVLKVLLSKYTVHYNMLAQTINCLKESMITLSVYSVKLLTEYADGTCVDEEGELLRK